MDTLHGPAPIRTLSAFNLSLVKLCLAKLSRSTDGLAFSSLIMVSLCALNINFSSSRVNFFDKFVRTLSKSEMERVFEVGGKRGRKEGGQKSFSTS